MRSGERLDAKLSHRRIKLLVSLASLASLLKIHTRKHLKLRPTTALPCRPSPTSLVLRVPPKQLADSSRPRRAL